MASAALLVRLTELRQSAGSSSRLPHYDPAPARLRAHPRQWLVRIAPGRALVVWSSNRTPGQQTATRDGNRTLIRPAFMDPKNDNPSPHGLQPAQAKLLAIILCGLAALYIAAAIVGGSIGALLPDNPQPLVVEKANNSA